MDLHTMDPACARTVNSVASHRGAANAGEGQTLDTAIVAMLFAMLRTEAPRLFLQHWEIDQNIDIQDRGQIILSPYCRSHIFS